MTKKPSYRFAGYTESWEEKKLGEISTSFSGGTPPAGNKKYYGGEIPFIRSAEINSDTTELFLTKEGLDNSSAKLVKEGDVLYALYGATSGEVGISKINGAINQAILSIIPKNNYTSEFIMQWLRLQKKNITDKYLQGGQGNLSGSIVKELAIFFPSLPEQTAIGSFFQDIDQLISLQQRKLEVLKEQKKTYLKLLFPAKGQTKPALRFAGFDDEWKEVKLGEVLTERNIQMVPSDQVPLVSFTVENGVTPKTERYNREFLVREESKKYKYTRYNDIVYNPANLKFGAIARNKYGEAVFSPIYVTFEVNYSNILPEFIEGILTSKDFIQQALKFQEGTVYERMAVKADDFTRLAITVPSLPEQEAIGSFFQDLDKAIAKQEEKVNQLKESKQTLLRKMFI